MLTKYFNTNLICMNICIGCDGNSVLCSYPGICLFALKLMCLTFNMSYSRGLNYNTKFTTCCKLDLNAILTHNVFTLN